MRDADGARMPADRADAGRAGAPAVAPARRDRPKRGRPGESFLLAFIAGAVDGVGYVLLHVFTAHITGNTVHMGSAIGEGTLADALRAGYAILTFVLGILGGALLRDACGRRGLPSRAVVLAAGCALLCGVAAVGEHLGRRHIEPGIWEFWVLAALAASAMGAQNAVASRVGGRRARTFITGIMTDFVEAVVDRIHTRDREEARSARRRAGLLFGVWAAYAAGAVASGATATRWGTASVVVPAALLAVAVADDVLAHRETFTRRARRPA